MAADQTVRLPGDSVRHDVYILRQEMHQRFDGLAEREDEAHAQIGARIDALQWDVNALQSDLKEILARLSAP